LAARSASLGQIYNDLGFQQLALVEGWKSINTDFVNFSAHRLLADSYAVLPRHEIAQVSELFQSCYVNLMSGVEYFYVDRRTDSTIGFHL
jgi:hypothetical protein